MQLWILVTLINLSNNRTTEQKYVTSNAALKQAADE